MRAFLAIPAGAALHESVNGPAGVRHVVRDLLPLGAAESPYQAVAT